MKLIDTTARKMNSPGKIAIHGAFSISLVASLSMFPHDGVGGWMPRPRNESVLSVMIAPPTPDVLRVQDQVALRVSLVRVP